MQWSDALGKPHGRYAGKPRVVSLVPSITELLLSLGLAEVVVGRTGFCIHPRQLVRRIPKLGGTKGFAFEREWAAVSAWVADVPRQKVLYLIWREPWLSVARDTYISRMLAAVGWDTLPVDSLVRYPEVDLSVLLREVDVVLLSSEPYTFRERHLRELCRRQLAGELPPAPSALIDGEMVSWYGTRAIAGLAYLRTLRTELGKSAGN
ncbi:hypothetical protein ACCAA_20046 [Candidatus Accumulibacter aalborgensis]|uniref:Periplasmic binding protein n=1 Tax=Candidatus Accumulibacter aalborgensis TaxID=1860102 RepID=A0A1A8XKK7_9PROT|nr:helical backbone metal receptor [Candidatus Accumulibacter aalborgensis]SBT04932.1 hypothetical protein ACCAA_20046 [Candidatus Accumulibacter aalborgensis]